MYVIRLGIPEMDALRSNLKAKAEANSLSKDEAMLYKKWGKAMGFWRLIPAIRVSEP